MHMSPELKLSVFDTTISITDTIKRDRITKKNLGPKEMEGEYEKEGTVKQEPPTGAAEIKEEVNEESQSVTAKEELSVKETKPAVAKTAAQKEPINEKTQQEPMTNAKDVRTEEERQAVAEAYRLFLEDPQDFLRSLQIMFSSEDGPGVSA